MQTNISIKNIQSKFVNRIEELSGENIYACYQCGKCTAGCPSLSEMDISPSEIIRLVQLGQEKEVLNSRAVWMCASCFTCVTRCPKGVDLARIMEALRQITLRKNVDYVSPLSIPKEILSQLPQVALVSSFRKMSA